MSHEGFVLFPILRGRWTRGDYPQEKFGERKVENLQHLGYPCFGDLKEPNYLNVVNNFRNILFCKKWNLKNKLINYSTNIYQTQKPEFSY